MSLEFRSRYPSARSRVARLSLVSCQPFPHKLSLAVRAAGRSAAIPGSKLSTVPGAAS